VHEVEEREATDGQETGTILEVVNLAWKYLKIVFCDVLWLFYVVLPRFTRFYHMTKYSTCLIVCYLFIFFMLIHFASHAVISDGLIWSWGSRATSATAKSFSLLRPNVLLPIVTMAAPSDPRWGRNCGIRYSSGSRGSWDTGRTER
jgi:hypothetical protein